MSDLNLSRLEETNDELTSINIEKDSSYLSSSFVLQLSLGNVQREEKVDYQLKAPLSISQSYEEEFFDRVS
jgi:hypothetical protein